MRWAEIRKDWLARPGFRETLDREYPYYDLALAIGELRAKLDLSQAELGQLIGAPQSTVARLESGRQNPSVGMLRRIAGATGTEVVVEFREPRRMRSSRDGQEVRSRDTATEKAGGEHRRDRA